MPDSDTRHPKLNRDAERAARAPEPPVAVSRLVEAGGVRYRAYSANAVIDAYGEYPGLREDFLRPPAQINEYSVRRHVGARADQ